MDPSASVLIVNWNGWQDTLECLESVFRSAPVAAARVVVCDNGSDDGSLERIRAWAEGRLEAGAPAGSALRDLTQPPVPRPIAYVEYDRATAERGGDPAAADVPLVLIRSERNLGFAAGNNVGLRYLMACGGSDYVWLLNNDTVVRPDALAQLLRTAAADARLGMVGSTLLYYDAPEVVQALGGASYNRWLALPRHLGARLPAAEAKRSAAHVAGRMAYVVGAAMLVSRAFVEEVGLMSEEYFLYFEELDWTLRAAGRYRIGYAPASVVYHKEGASTGVAERGTARGALADGYFLRNRLRVTRRFAPHALPTVCVALGVALLRRAARGEWDRVAGAWRALRAAP